MTRPAPFWTMLPAAADLLADCAANPPRSRMARIVGLSTYYAPEYVGKRVKWLNAIWKAERGRLFRMRDLEAFKSCTAYPPQTAIADAIFFARFAAPKQRAAA